MMALELLDTKWAGVIQPDPDSAQAGDVETEHILAPADGPRRTVMFRLRVYTATELARLLEDVGLPRSSALATSTGGSSRVRAGSLCEPESRSRNRTLAAYRHRFPMDVRSCPVDESVEI